MFTKSHIIEDRINGEKKFFKSSFARCGSSIYYVSFNGRERRDTCGIFADVGAEPKAVYEHLDWLEKQLSYPIYRVQWRNLKDDIISASKGEYKAFTAPFYTKNTDTSKKGMLRRQCTGDYKIKPITKKIREFKSSLLKFNIPIIYEDERLSSLSAKKSMVIQNIKTGYNKPEIDMRAAAIILQQHLDKINN